VARPSGVQENAHANEDAQDEKLIDLETRRSHAHQSDNSTPTMQQKKADAQSEMRKILKKNPQAKGADLAKMTGLSISQANRIKAQILQELANEPA